MKVFKYFPSDEAQDVIRSVRSHGPILCILETVTAEGLRTPFQRGSIFVLIEKLTC